MPSVCDVARAGAAVVVRLMGVYIDAFAVWESNAIGAPWYSAPFKLVLMLLLLGVVLVVVVLEAGVDSDGV